MTPKLVIRARISKRLSTPFPCMGSKNISLDITFSYTLNCNHTIHFQTKLGEYFNARKTSVLYQNFQKVTIPPP